MNDAALTMIGTGSMGAALAQAVAVRGNRVVAWNRTHAKAEVLRSEWVTPERDIAAAVAASPVIVVCVANYDVARQALADTDLDGRTVLNLTTGTSAEAGSMTEWAKERGARYLEGIVFCYPADVGTPGGSVLVSGDHAAWEAVADFVHIWGHSGTYLGTDPALANVLDTALVGAFHIPALVAWVEAADFALKAGIAPETLTRLVLDSLTRFRDRVAGVVDQLARHDFASPAASLSTYANATEHFRATVGRRASAEMLEAAAEVLADARKVGLGDLALSSLATRSSR